MLLFNNCLAVKGDLIYDMAGKFSRCHSIFAGIISFMIYHFLNAQHAIHMLKLTNARNARRLCP